MAIWVLKRKMFVNLFKKPRILLGCHLLDKWKLQNWIIIIFLIQFVKPIFQETLRLQWTTIKTVSLTLGFLLCPKMWDMESPIRKLEVLNQYSIKKDLKQQRSKGDVQGLGMLLLGITRIEGWFHQWLQMSIPTSK